MRSGALPGVCDNMTHWANKPDICAFHSTCLFTVGKACVIPPVQEKGREGGGGQAGRDLASKHASKVR